MSTTPPPLSPPNRIRRRKLSDEIRERLLEAVNSGRFRPGDPFPSERELMEQYGVGRPAIREALQALQAMGLIEVRHGERPRVAAPRLDHLHGQMIETMRHVMTHDPKVLTELKEARVLMEVALVRIAAELRSDAQLTGLRAIVDQQRAAQANADAFRELDSAFHRAIAAISGNGLLTSLCGAVFDWMAMFHRDMVHAPGLERLTVAEHEAIIEAIASGDSGRAAHAMTDHLQRANSLYRAPASS
ncbi:transcriptional regulator NanR [Paracoccus sp. S-4012]|nr:transcriptional regulator NanR [Paracoccus sp. S-4012]